jgi:hypothetical protein
VATATLRNERVTIMLDELIANYQAAEQRVNDLAILWAVPKCGVPGFGFKAARKAMPQRLVAGVKLAQARHALRNYVTSDKKLSKERRARRFEAIKTAIPSFTLE